MEEQITRAALRKAVDGPMHEERFSKARRTEAERRIEGYRRLLKVASKEHEKGSQDAQNGEHEDEGAEQYDGHDDGGGAEQDDGDYDGSDEEGEDAAEDGD